MASIEKQYQGIHVRVAAGLVAVAFAIWTASCLIHNAAALPRCLCIVYVAFFAAVAWWRWQWGIDLAILNLPLWIILPMRLGAPNFSLIEAALFAAAIGGAIRVARTGRFRWFATPVTPYMALFGLAAVLAAFMYFVRNFFVIDSILLRNVLDSVGSILSMNPASPYYPLRGTLTLLEGLVFFHVVVARVREPKALRRLVLLSVISAVLVSLFGIVQYKTDWNRIENFEAWAHRVNATFPDVNSLGSFLVANLFLLLPLAWNRLDGRTKRDRLFRWSRLPAWMALLLILTVLYMSHSRAAALAAILTLPIYLLLRSERFALERPVVLLYKKRRFITMVFLLIMLIVGFAVMGLDHPSHTDLAWTRTEGRVAHALKGRLNLWRGGLYLAAEEPWLGSGPGAFYSSIRWHWEFTNPEDWNPWVENAHNYFLQILAETGVIGLTIYLLTLGLILYQGLRAILIHRDLARRMLTGVWCGLIALLLTCLTGHPLLIIEMNLWFAMAAALLFVPSETESVEFAIQENRRRGLFRVLSVLLIFALLAGWSHARRPRLPITASRGMYPVESDYPGYPYNWLRRHAAFRIYQMRPDLVFCLMNPFGAAKPNDVTIRVNGREIDRRRLDTTKWQVCVYRLHATVRTSIKLEIDSSWEISLPNDPRRFAVRIQSLEDNTM